MSYEWLALESKFDGREPPPRTTVLTAAGTWAPMDVGYPADVAERLDNEQFLWWPINYPAVGFLNPDPNTSYNESVDLGVAEGLRLVDVAVSGLGPEIYTDAEIDALPFEAFVEIPVDLVGYSQGAEVVVRILRALAHRGLRPRRVITFGSPCRAPGPTMLGNNPPGSGISRLYAPPALRRIVFDFTLPGDMYANTPDGTYLPEFYDLFVQAEATGPFFGAVMQFLLPFILKGIGGVVTGGLFGAIGAVDPPKAIRTMTVLTEFAATNAHGSYHLPRPEYGGRSAVQAAVDVLNAV